MLFPELAGGEIAHRYHETGIPDQLGAAGNGLRLIAEDVVGVGGEAEAGAVELSQPPAGARADAREVGVGVPGGIAAHLLQHVANVGCLIHPHLVRAVSPLAEREHHALGQQIGFLPLLDELDETLLLREEVHPVHQLGGEMADALFPGVMDGEDLHLHAQSLEFQDFPHAEGLRERGKSFEHIGDMRGGHCSELGFSGRERKPGAVAGARFLRSYFIVTV